MEWHESLIQYGIYGLIQIVTGGACCLKLCISGILHTEMQIGYESFNYTRREGDDIGVRVRISGENIRDFVLTFTQGKHYAT